MTEETTQTLDDPEDYLVECWRLQAAGREEDARQLLAGVWSWAMDGSASEKMPRVALRLLGRLGFVSDAADDWRALPDELEVYRAESGGEDGLCWTLDRSIAEKHARRHELTVSRGRVSKADVLAYITHRGEDEIVVPRERVKER
jgi:hypothetical protein